MQSIYISAEVDTVMPTSGRCEIGANFLFCNPTLHKDPHKKQILPAITHYLNQDHQPDYPKTQDKRLQAIFVSGKISETFSESTSITTLSVNDKKNIHAFFGGFIAIFN